jgi:hypothetical protein
MEKESVLKNIMVENTTTAFLTAERDFPLGESKYYRILDGKYVRAKFNNKKVECSSDDMIIGRKIDGEKRKCESCDDLDICAVSARLILTNLTYGTVYYLNVPYMAQVNLSQYVEKLLINDMDAPDVITKITRVKNGKFTMYTFELVDRWFNEEELNNIKPICKAYTLASDEEKEDFNLELMLKLKGISDQQSELIKKLLGL